MTGLGYQQSFNQGSIVRSLPFPKRLQLVKLLRAHGLRDVERLREDELKEALARLSILLPDLQAHTTVFAPSPSSTMGGRSAAPVALADDDEDHYCLPRFREPRLFLPDGERTFLRAIAVKPRVLFFTWELHRDLRPVGHAQLQIFVRDTLGDAPNVVDLLGQHPSFVIDVDASAPGWYVTIPGERTAVAAALLIDGVRVCTSNLALTPPTRPAPPGPLWEATLGNGVSRRALRQAGLVRGRSLPVGVVVATRGEAVRIEVKEAAAVAVEDDTVSSTLLMRGSSSSSSSSSSPSSSSSSSSPSSSSSSSSFQVARVP